ncbi:MAG: WYL domain-containing protein [Clostridia bacterium]|nr:WYL domain-containing protein [Clostridia bacterium]
MQDQSRILMILRYLYEKTDPEHQISSKDIKRMLENDGIHVPVSRTIDSDVDQLIAAGHDIVKTHENGRPMFYNVVGREFDTVELKTLIDAVAASRFISVERSKRMISRLAGMASISDRPYLESTLNHVRSIKKAVGGTMYVADALFRAVVTRRKIQFHMIDYAVPDKSIVPHRDDKTYEASPYATIWCNDRYYLVAYDEERECIITPRLDHIRKVKILDEEITPAPKGFDLAYYYSSIYKMYGGEEMDVTLECRNHLLGKFIDRFGTDFECVPVSEHAFQATVKCCIGNTFLGWLFQYAGEMRIVGPQKAIDLYRDQLQTAFGSL